MDKSGYSISKIFCTEDTITDIYEKFVNGLSNDSIMQRVYNADFGVGYIPKGSQIDKLLLDSCIDKSYRMPGHLEEGMSFMGIDVGNNYNVVIRQLHKDKLIAVYIDVIDIPGGFDKFNFVLDLIRRYRVSYAVIDGMPELGIAKDFCNNFRGGWRWFKCGEKEDRADLDKKIVNANRTLMIDDFREALKVGTIINPANIHSVKGYYEEITTPVRYYNDVRKVFEWVNFNDAGKKVKKDDHYLFAESFCNLAYKLYKVYR